MEQQTQNFGDQSPKYQSDINTMETNQSSFLSYQSSIKKQQQALRLKSTKTVQINSNEQIYGNHGVFLKQNRDGSLVIDIDFGQRDSTRKDLEEDQLLAKNLQLQLRVQQLEQLLQSGQKSTEFYIQKVAEKDQELDALRNKIATIERVLSHKNEQITKLDIQNNELNTKISQLRKQITQSDYTVEVRPASRSFPAHIVSNTIRQRLQSSPSHNSSQENRILQVMAESCQIPQIIRQIPVYIERQVVRQVPVYIIKQVQREVIKEVPVPIFFDRNGSQIKKSLRSLIAESEQFRQETQQHLTVPNSCWMAFKRTQSFNQPDKSFSQRTTKKYSLGADQNAYNSNSDNAVILGNDSIEEKMQQHDSPLKQQNNIEIKVTHSDSDSKGRNSFVSINSQEVQQQSLKNESLKNESVNFEYDNSSSNIFPKSQHTPVLAKDVSVQFSNQIEPEAVKQQQVIQITRHVPQPYLIVQLILVQTIVQVVREVAKQPQIDEKQQESLSPIKKLLEYDIQQQPQRVVQTVEVIKQIVREIPVYIEKEVTRIIPYQVVREVIKQVPVIKEITTEVEKVVPVIKEVIKEVPVFISMEVITLVPHQVQKEVEVIREVQREVEVIKYVDVIREIEKPIYVQKIVEVIRWVEKPVQIVREILVQRIVQVVKQVPIQVIKQVYKNVQIYREQQPIQKVLYSNNPIDIGPDDDTPHKSHGSSGEKKRGNSDHFYHNSPASQIKAKLESNSASNQFFADRLQRAEQDSRMILEQNAYLKEKIIDLTNKVQEEHRSSRQAHQDLKRRERDLSKRRTQQNSHQKQKTQKMDTQWLERFERQEKQMHELNEKNSHLLVQLEDQRSNNKIVQKDRKTSQLECFSLKQSLRQLAQNHEQEIKAMQNQLQGSREQTHQLNGMVDELQALLNQAADQLKASYKKNAEIEQQLHSAKQLIQTIQNGSEQQQDSNFQLKQNELRERHQKQLQQLKTFYLTNLMSLKRKIELLESQIGTLQHKNSELRSRTSSQNKIIDLDQLNEQQQMGRQRRVNTLHYSSIQEPSPIKTYDGRHSNGKRSKITIRDLHNQSYSQPSLNLQELHQKYQRIVDEKDYEIKKLKQLIFSYEKVIINHQSSEGHYFDNRTQGPHQGMSNSKYHAEMNGYINSLLNQLSQTQSDLTAQKHEKRKLEATLRALGSVQQQLNVRSSRYSPKGKTFTHSPVRKAGNLEDMNPDENDSILLQEVVNELEREKSKNQKCRQRINILNEQVTQLQQFLEKRQVAIRQIAPSFSEKQNLGAEQELKLYKTQYHNVVETNNRLRKEVKELKEKLRNVNSCVRHLQVISNLSEKIKEYEQHVIPELRQEIKSVKQASVRNQKSDKFSEVDPERQSSEVFCEVVSFCEAPKKVQNIPLAGQKDVSLDTILKTRTLQIMTKQLICLKLIELTIQTTRKGVYESLGPQKIFISSIDSPGEMKIQKRELSKKATQQLKYYQAPEVLRGEKESQKSVVWNLGIIMDQIFKGKPFYTKFVDIFSRAENYSFGAKSSIGTLLERMIIKNKLNRMSLIECQSALVKLMEQKETNF